VHRYNLYAYNLQSTNEPATRRHRHNSHELQTDTLVGIFCDYIMAYL